MHINEPVSLRNALSGFPRGSDSFISSAEVSITRDRLLGHSIFGGRRKELSDRSVLIVTTDQLTAGLALFELDGLARRIVVYPNESTLNYLPCVINAARVDAIVSDLPVSAATQPHIEVFKPCPIGLSSDNGARRPEVHTEWITLTSGTTGRPKLVVHTLASLIGAIDLNPAPSKKVIWGTLYDIRRFGGLQVFLRAIMKGASLVLSSSEEPISSYLARAGSIGVTHISGTPSQWRRALMSGSAHLIAPEYVRLSGEIADQAILNQLQSVYPRASVVHAFGSSEAGTVFEVKDGVAGFPSEVIQSTPNVEMKIKNRTLRVRSSRTASHFLGDDVPLLKDADGFVDTGDIVDLHSGRYHFVGRSDGRINVGGLKVHPEEVEAVINRHPSVHMSWVHSKKNPVIGTIVVADVVLNSLEKSPNSNEQQLQRDILRFCGESLPAHKLPATIRFVPALAVAESGKLVRKGD